MKKLMLVLAASLLVALTACGGGGENRTMPDGYKLASVSEEVAGPLGVPLPVGATWSWYNDAESKYTGKYAKPNTVYYDAIERQDRLFAFYELELGDYSKLDHYDDLPDFNGMKPCQGLDVAGDSFSWSYAGDEGTLSVWIEQSTPIAYTAEQLAEAEKHRAPRVAIFHDPNGTCPD